jgi:hypothetical protein
VNDLPSIKAVLEHYGAVIRREGKQTLNVPFMVTRISQVQLT